MEAVRNLECTPQVSFIEKQTEVITALLMGPFTIEKHGDGNSQVVKIKMEGDQFGTTFGEGGKTSTTEITIVGTWEWDAFKKAIQLTTL